MTDQAILIHMTDQAILIHIPVELFLEKLWDIFLLYLLIFIYRLNLLFLPDSMFFLPAISFQRLLIFLTEHLHHFQLLQKQIEVLRDLNYRTFRPITVVGLKFLYGGIEKC
jgi:hypothetical protein